MSGKFKYKYYINSNKEFRLHDDEVAEYLAAEATDLIEEIERLENDNKHWKARYEKIKRLEDSNDNNNWKARYDALFKTNEYLRHKGESITYHGFTKEELQVMMNQLHPDKHDGKTIYNSIMQKLLSIKQ